MAGFDNGPLQQPWVFNQNPDPLVVGELLAFKIVFVHFLLGPDDVLGLFVELHQDVAQGFLVDGLVFQVLDDFRLMAFFLEVFQAGAAFAAAGKMIDLYIAGV